LSTTEKPQWSGVYKQWAVTDSESEDDNEDMT